MIHTRCLHAALLLLICTLPFKESRAADETHALTDAEAEFFESKIRPVLVQHCYECHAADSKNVKGGLLLDSRDAIRKGGDSGPAVVPGKVDASLLIDALRYDSFEMPPKGKLPDEVIEDFVKWVQQGAPDPRVGGTVQTTEIDFEEARKFWSFQAVERPDVPEVRRADWPQNEIDHFVMRRLEQQNLVPVAAAEKRHLIRRATFDLIGLPPTSEEVADFLADDSDQAFAKVVERLLNSPHYGERWGRYWLDVARFAEDQAHTFAVKPNSSGYRYRDWVISAFNQDVPYDRFVKMQIAGDLIGAESPDSWDHLVAPGFFGLGAQYYKNSDAAKAAADELDDRVDTLSRGFLGLTVSCARCHDHKFDPIPTQDYYSLAGIFRSSKLHNAPLCSESVVRAYNDGQRKIKAAEKKFNDFVAECKAQGAESKVGQVSEYIQAVWLYRSSQENGKSANTSEFARSRGVNEYLFKRWINFLDPSQKGKVEALSDWFDRIDAGILPSDTVPPDVIAIADDFQGQLVRLLNIRDGVAVTNLAKPDPDAPHVPGTPRFVTPLVTRVRPTAAIDVEIAGASQLYLVVSDGGNGNSCDHSDWLNPVLIGPEGDIRLTDLKWKSLDGFGGGRVNTNYMGQPLRVGGKKYQNGVGVHAPCTVVYDLPAGVTRFKATGGLDNSGSDQGGCGDQAAIQFSVYTEMPTEGPGGNGSDLISKVLGKDGPFAVSDKDLEQILEPKVRVEYQQLKEGLDEARNSAPPMYPIAHSYAEGNVADMKIFVRGNPANQKGIAPRRFLTILATEKNEPYKVGSGRKELAQEIASPTNPLTARVMVNRIWQHHFGRGIVATASNFGQLGERPTHPDLLDYLASVFVETGWSVKEIHRQIMLSATYQLSSDSHTQNMEIDADNQFLWKMNRRRLDVEAWRDALLEVSGQLDRSFGGPSTNLADPNNVRRTVYAKVSRHELDNLLRLFDFPDANITSAARSETTVPQQQLFVLNSPFMIQRAKAFAARVTSEAGDDVREQIRRAFELAYGRPPSSAEVEPGLAYLLGTDEENVTLSRWERYAQVLLAANEFMYLD